MQSHTFIIAEAGVNHNGSIDVAKKLVEAAAESGADAVKFQTFKADNLVCRGAAKAEYQARNTNSGESQYEMIRKLELDADAHDVLINHCRKCNIQFLSTPFDFESLELLTGRFNLPCIKVSSGDVTNAPLLLKMAESDKPIILSTGMCTLGEIEDALGVLAFGYIKRSSPSKAEFRSAFCSPVAFQILKDKVTLLHCTTEYPTPLEEVNLRVMDTLKSTFGLRVGYSDHTEGIAVSIAAVARGAVLIEKHFTLDRTLPGPDHKASLEPTAFKSMVQAIREVENVLGTGIKRPSQSEIKNMPIARKSLVASCPIAYGELFSMKNLAVKRPGNGISPLHYWDFLGRTANREYACDEVIQI